MSPLRANWLPQFVPHRRRLHPRPTTIPFIANLGVSILRREDSLLMNPNFCEREVHKEIHIYTKVVAK